MSDRLLDSVWTTKTSPPAAPLLAKERFIHISITTSTGAFAPLSPPNSGGRPEFEVPQNWGI